jgi:hypothetical protein
MTINRTILLSLLLLPAVICCAQVDNPFESIGKKGKILTLSNGKYVETFDYDSVERIGSVLINIRTRKVVRLLKSNLTFRKYSDNSGVSRWWGKDPMAEKYYSQSPYGFALNNPILFNDPDGRDVDPTKLKGKGNISALNNVLSTKAGLKMIGQFMHKGGEIKITLDGKTTTYSFNKEGARANDNLVLVSSPNSQMNPESAGAAGAPREGLTREFEKGDYTKQLGDDKDYDTKKGVTSLVNLNESSSETESTNTLSHELFVHVDQNEQRLQNLENKVVDGTIKPGTKEYATQLQNITNSGAADHAKLGQGQISGYQNISAQLDHLKNTNQYTELYKQDVKDNH